MTSNFNLKILLLLGLGHTGLTNYIPLYYVSYLKGDPTYASLLLSSFLLAGALGTLIGGPVSDLFGRKVIMKASMILTIPLLYLFVHTHGVITMIVLFFMGTVLVSSFSTTLVLGQELMPNNVGMASGLTIGFGMGMGGLGAVLMGYVADSWQVPTVFTFLMVFAALALIVVYLLPIDNLDKQQNKSPQVAKVKT